jgi:hypothetical protein
MDLGDAAAHKHTMGGWEDGWSVGEASEGQSEYFEANARKARLWFTPPAGSYDRVTVRLKVPKGRQDVGFHINGKLTHTAAVSTQWQEVAFDVPEGHARAGENELELRFAEATRIDGCR